MDIVQPVVGQEETLPEEMSIKRQANELVSCPRCKNTVAAIDFFCPICGHKLKTPPPATGIGKQIIVYAVSFFLPPFGLWPAIKYFKQPDSKSKKIGWTAVILTMLSLLLSVWITIALFQSFNQQYKSQVNAYKDLQKLLK